METAKRYYVQPKISVVELQRKFKLLYDSLESGQSQAGEGEGD